MAKSKIIEAGKSGVSCLYAKAESKKEKADRKNGAKVDNRKMSELESRLGEGLSGSAMHGLAMSLSGLRTRCGVLLIKRRPETGESENMLYWPENMK